MSEFKWPCSRRVAHRPHQVQRTDILLPVMPPKAAYRDCLGVKAHPDTAIGGAHDGKPAMYGQIDVGELTGKGSPLPSYGRVQDWDR